MNQLSFWEETVQTPPTPSQTSKPLSAEKGAVSQTGECSNKYALRCITAAARMQKHIEARHHSANNLLRQPPTRKRLRDAETMRSEAIRLERVQGTLRRLAAMHEGATILPELAPLTSREAVESALFNSSNDSSIRELYNSVGRDERKEERVLRMSQEALLQTIPGYFPTPDLIAHQLVDLAQIEPGNRVLEPSAGTGSLIDAVLKRQSNVQLFFCELNCFLLDILREKYEGSQGIHFLGRDLMDLDLVRASQPFDRIIMNPPFERGQDAEHVLHAYSMLAPGGLLAGIVSAGLFSRSDSKAKAFREFAEKTGAVVQEVAAGAFKNSGTGVGGKIVRIQKAVSRQEAVVHRLSSSKAPNDVTQDLAQAE